MPGQLFFHFSWKEMFIFIVLPCFGLCSICHVTGNVIMFVGSLLPTDAQMIAMCITMP